MVHLKNYSLLIKYVAAKELLSHILTTKHKAADLFPKIVCPGSPRKLGDILK